MSFTLATLQNLSPSYLKIGKNTSFMTQYIFLYVFHFGCSNWQYCAKPVNKNNNERKKTNKNKNNTQAIIRRISVLNKWHQSEYLIAYKLTEPGCFSLPKNCTLWLVAKKFRQENIRLMLHSENILMVSHLQLSTYLLFLWHRKKKKPTTWSFLSRLVKCLLYQYKMCRIKCAVGRNALLRGRSVAGERGWNSPSID